MMFQGARPILPFLVLAMLMGCANAPPRDIAEYLLRPSPAVNAKLNGLPDGTVRVGLGELRVAEYLNSRGIVLGLGQRQVRPARYHRWAEPLSDSLRLLISANVSAILGQTMSLHASSDDNYRVDVYIEEFHGTRDGAASLTASWTTSASSPAAEYRHRFSTTEDIRSSGYPALVNAQHDLAEALATAIAESLRPLITAASTCAPDPGGCAHRWARLEIAESPLRQAFDSSP